MKLLHKLGIERERWRLALLFLFPFPQFSFVENYLLLNFFLKTRDTAGLRELQALGLFLQLPHFDF